MENNGIVAEDRMVSHPKHYEKGQGHIECIDLLSLLCHGYKDIFANEVGQSKYLYRAGTKAEEGYTLKQKTIQDLKKIRWYMSDFKLRAKTYMEMNNLSFGPVVYYNNDKEYIPLEVSILKYEFTFDKPEIIKEDIAEIIGIIYRFDSIQSVDKVIALLDKLIEKVMSLDSNLVAQLDY